MAEKEVKKVVYTCVVGDLFHHGHLKALKFARSLGDYLICGVLTDEIVKSYRREPVINFENRKTIIESLNFIDEVIKEENLDATMTLKKIHEKFKDAKLIFVRGERWKSFPEVEYLNEINGELIKYLHPKDLSEFDILKNLLEFYKGKFNNFEEFLNYFKVRDFIDYGARKIKTAIMSTKADTLKSLNPMLTHSSIEKPLTFTLKEWRSNKKDILGYIKKEFSPNLIVIRSSALNEDSVENSMAGYFDTVLNVPSNNLNKVEDAVSTVIKSYSDNKEFNNEMNQILIQKQTQEISISGVIFTKTLENGAPYYTINYDNITGYSDTVTKGLEYKTLSISRFSNPKDYPNEFYKLLISVEEIEKLIPDTPLDIEFAINKKGEVIIFQVRPLIIRNHCGVNDEDLRGLINELKDNFRELSKRKPHLAGDYTFLADMPDWNPAEIIGDRPNLLAYSLYDCIITDAIWHNARTSQGYYNVDPAKLVVLIADKPYTDVRNTFNSFTPASLSNDLREKLVNFYMNKLRKHPELQDKVEFEVLYTCYDLNFEDISKELIEAGFNGKEVNQLKDALIDLTNNLVLNSKKTIQEDITDNYKIGILIKDINSKLTLERDYKTLINCAFDLINDCKKNGTLQFSRLARLAFIGKIILNSLVKKNIITQEYYDSFLNSISTVATSLNLDFMLFLKNKLNKDEFLKKYGHLRPSTYDITSMRYDKNLWLLDAKSEIFLDHEKKDFLLDNKLSDLITNGLNEHGLKFDAEFLFDFIKKSIEARELSKFEFTKSLSYAIELIAEAGENIGFSREEISNCDLELLSKVNDYNYIEFKDLIKNLIDLRIHKKDLYQNLVLPQIIFSENNFDFVLSYSSKPNFITNKKISAEVINLDNISEDNLQDLKNKIVLLESGDPGYDWIFTKDIGGLITKYGGVASHMSIRAAEFGLPAAIGCGTLFDRIKNEQHLFLDCETRKIVPFKNYIN